MPTHRRLPTEVKNMLARIQLPASGFDRLSFWLDHPAPILPAAALRNHCRKLVINGNQAKPYQSLWQTHVALYQPDQKALQLLEVALRHGRYRSRADYAELALDLITATSQDAALVRDFLLGHMFVPHCRRKVLCVHNETYYFNPRTPAGGGKAGRVTALYADRPSKLAGRRKGRPCCHLEHRYTGSEALGGIGLNCLADFASFSHAAYWRAHLHLARLPAKADVGRFLLPEKADCSGTALRKRADKFLAPYYLKGALILQNIRRDHPQISRLWTPLDAALLLPESQ